MAKYLDQAGAQHFAEALMASTKTIGGQTIWGSGNIEAGGGNNIIEINQSSDLDNYATQLADFSQKTVILGGDYLSSLAVDMVIRNAQIFVNPPDSTHVKLHSTANIYLINCTVSPYSINPITYAKGARLCFECKYLYLINSHITIYWPATEASTKIIQTTSTSIYNSNLFITDVSYVEDANSYSNVKTNLNMLDNGCIRGASFTSDSQAMFAYGNNTTLNNYTPIMCKCERCNFSIMPAQSIQMGTSVYSAYFFNCILPSTGWNSNQYIFNADYCWTLNDEANSHIYAGPTTGTTNMTQKLGHNILM